MKRAFSRLSGLLSRSFGAAFEVTSRLVRERSGATAVTFVLVSVPLIVCMGGAADYYLLWRQRADLQTTVDGAVMAGAIKADEGSDSDTIKAAVANHVSKTFDTPFGANSTVTTTIDTKLGQVATNVVATMKTSFLKVIGLKTLTFQAGAAANYGGGLLEVALAIDVTGSMDGAKLTGAKSAAKDLVQTLFTVPGTSKVNDKVRMGLVPFARYVNIGTGSRGQSWLDVADDKTWTTQECWNNDVGGYCAATQHISTTCYSDGTPYACSWDQCTKWVSGKIVQVCGPVPHSTAWYGCVGSRAAPADLQAEASAASKIPGLMDTWCNAELVRLTKSQSTLNTAIDSLYASDETYIAPGLLWGWRVLSSKPPFSDGTANSPNSKKAIILMTDGANTLSATPPYHWGTDVADSNATLAKTCTNAKADGIAIYTIAFAVTDPTIKSILTNCATNSSYFFDSSNVSQMQAAFKQIGAQLSSRRLVY